MIDWFGRVRRFLAMGMLAAVLLSGCGSTAGDLSASSSQLLEEETQEETMAQELQKQLMAILNLERSQEDRITSDAALEQAAAFFLDYVLQDPQAYLREEDPATLEDMLFENTYAFVYDGELSATEVGKRMLDILKDLEAGNIDQETFYRNLQSIAVAYGKGEKGAVWLMLALYPAEEQATDPDESEDENQNAGGTDGTGAGQEGEGET